MGLLHHLFPTTRVITDARLPYPGVTVTVVQSKRQGGENQLPQSFASFVDRPFHDEISGININYDLGD